MTNHSKNTEKFAEKMKAKSTQELQVIAFSRDKYNDEFMLSCWRELHDRKSLPEELVEKWKESEENWNKEKVVSTQKTEEPFIPADLPRNLKIASGLMMFSLVIDLIILFVGHREYSYSLNSITLPSNIVTVFLSLFILRGKKWPVWIYTLVYLNTNFIHVVGISQSFKLKPIWEIVLSTAVIILLYSASSRKYFRKKKQI
ncbi:MAG: hypothetical protein SchgKO_06290 [Schleiferiaceae bacterium]